MELEQIETIIQRVLSRYEQGTGHAAIRVEASARHAHINAEALAQLFGPGAVLNKQRELSQPGEFLSDKRIKLVTPKGELANVAVLGPLRDQVQVELSATDCRALGIKAPINLSGDLRNAGDVFIVGDTGCMSAPGSVIIARAHIHLTTADAEQMQLKDGQTVEVRINSARPLTMGGVVVRVRDSFSAAMHIDFDEANACALGPDSQASILLNTACCAKPAPAACAKLERAAAPGGAAFTGKVVTEAMAKQLVSGHSGGSVSLPVSAILTPSARDIFLHADCSVVRV